MRRKVLIISPNFPPIATPDQQRVRMSLPYFEEFGWTPHVLALRPETRSNAMEWEPDYQLERTVPANIKISRAGAIPAPTIRALGLASLGLRCLPYLRRSGDRIIAEERPDLIYFSTTLFPVMALGPGWRKRFGTPYILDFQDPWFSGAIIKRSEHRPPGGRLKYGFSQALARFLEPYALRHASHTVAVSSAYPKMLMKRYAWLNSTQFTVLPFGASEEDFEDVRGMHITQKVINTADGNRHWVYIGVLPPSMQFTLRAFLVAVKEARQKDPKCWARVRIHFIGTNYAGGSNAEKRVEPLAKELGVEDLVNEQPLRMPYLEALSVLLESDAILLFGSDDAGYTASKLFPCILAKKPILAVFHEQSSVVEILNRCNAGRAITFATGAESYALASRVIEGLDWLLSLSRGYSPETNWDAFRPYTAREMTRRQCEIFDKCMEGTTGG